MIAEKIDNRPELSEKATTLLEYMKDGRYKLTRQQLMTSKQLKGSYDMILKELTDAGYLSLDDSGKKKTDWIYTLNEVPERIEQTPAGLIKALKKNTFGNEIVDARKLWEFLEVKSDFDKWIARRIEQYDFVENIDFSPNLAKSTGGRPSKEYDLTINMAKELCMIENNPMGKSARRYFIYREEQAKKLLAKRDGVISDRLEEAMISCHKSLEALSFTVSSGLFQASKRIEGVEQEVSDVKTDVSDIKSNVVYLNRKFEQVTKRFRKNFTKETTQLHIEVVYHDYNGKCPCCNERIIVNQSKILTSKAVKDHIDNDVSNRSPYRTWIICSECNYRKENKMDFAKVKVFFEAYQARLKDYQEKKKKLIAEQQFLFT